MKVTVKTLKGEIYTIEVQPTTTILDVKNLIKGYKDISPELQKVVFKGKNTVDTDAVGTLGVKEGDFFVVMFSNTKKETKTQQGEKKVEEKKEIKDQKKEQKQTDKKTTGSSNNAENENSINMITGMGFDRPTAIAALAAAFNDVNRAIQYCCTGIPGGAGIPVGDFEQQSAMQIEGEQEVDPAILETILNSAHFVQMRESFQNDPSSLPQLISQLSTSNPTLFSVITQYPDLFQQLLTGQLPEEMQEEGDQEGEDEDVIQLSNTQEQAVNRLSALGFSKIQAAQAYLACDKNEQLAANLLFDRQGKDDIEPGQGEDFGDDNDNLFS